MKIPINKTRTSRPAGMVMLACAVALAPCSVAQIINEDFESFTAGDRPLDVLLNGSAYSTAIRPSVNDPNNTLADGDGIILGQIVTGAANVAGGGSGNGLQLVDDESGAATPDHTAGYEVDIVQHAIVNPVTSVHVSFDIAWTDISGSTDHSPLNGTHAFRMGLGAYDESTSLRLGDSSRRFCTVEFENDGGLDGFGASPIQLLNGTPAAIDLFANDSDTETISYTPPGGGTAMLAPNEVVLYVDGNFEGSETLVDNDVLADDMDGILTGDYNLGRFGFSSFSSAVGLSYTVDNLLINEIVDSPFVLFENFETREEGTTPPADRDTPNPPELLPERYYLVIPESDEFGIRNVAGTGKGMEFLDLSTGSTGLGWNLVPSASDSLSTLKFSVDFAWFNAQGMGSSAELFLAVGRFGELMSSNSRRDLPMRFHEDGRVSFGEGGSGDFQITGLVNSYGIGGPQSYNLTFYLNDQDNDKVIYDDPNGTTRLLGTNTADFYVDNQFIGSVVYRDYSEPDDPMTGEAPVVDGDNNIGRIGFGSGSSDLAGGYAFDNIEACEIVPSTGTPILFKEDFEDDTVGGPPIADGPQGFTVVTGAANVAGGGTDNGVHQFDNGDATSPGGTIVASDYQVNTASVGNMHISFDTAWNDIQTTGVLDPALGQAKVRVGQVGKGMTSGTRSYFDLQLSSKGEVNAGGSILLQLTDNVPVHVDIFVNDHDTDPVDYPSPAGGTVSLAAESWAVYVDDMLLATNLFDTDVTDPITGTVGNETLGRLGIVSATDDLEIDYTYDNICITPIPAISTELSMPVITDIVATSPDTVQLTFSSDAGNSYRIWHSTDPDLFDFSVLTTIPADPGSSTTYTRSGVTLDSDNEYFQVENIGPTP